MLFLFAYINSKLPISLDEMWVINAVVRNDNSTVFYNYIHNDYDLFISFSRMEFFRRFPLFEFPFI